MSSMGRKALSGRGIVGKEDCTSMKPYFNSVTSNDWSVGVSDLCFLQPGRG